MKSIDLSQGRFRLDRSGASAVEFALVLPLMLALFFGGYVYSETVSVNRKVTITTRAIADLTSQYALMSTNDMNTVLAASTQIIAPFNATPLSIRVSEITVDLLGNATIKWSVPQNTTAYKQGATYTLPVGAATPGFYYILSEVSYSYSPPALYGLIKPFALSDSILMLPRVSTSVGYNGS